METVCCSAEQAPAHWGQHSDHMEGKSSLWCGLLVSSSMSFCLLGSGMAVVTEVTLGTGSVAIRQGSQLVLLNPRRQSQKMTLDSVGSQVLLQPLPQMPRYHRDGLKGFFLKALWVPTFRSCGNITIPISGTETHHSWLLGSEAQYHQVQSHQTC